MDATPSKIDPVRTGTPCRYCGTVLTHSLIDLGDQPLANSYLRDRPEDIAAERRYPLHVKVCGGCFLAQVETAVPADAIFSDYAYFSSYSASWVAHAERYAKAMIDRFGIGPNSLVVEIASNDGYLLKHFRDRSVPVLGVEPAANVAAVAEQAGIPTEVAFFNRETGRRLAEEGHCADLMAANNVLAHVPDIRDFAAGFPEILTPEGVATFEFPHLLRLIDGTQFDTIYHEHYSYLSLLVVERVFADVGLRVFDVEELPTHGGSLRVFACRAQASHAETARLAALRAVEAEAGLHRIDTYLDFTPKAERVRAGFRAFLARCKAEGKTVAGYGAAAKGNTFLNYCGATAGDLVCVVDRNPEKQGRLLPGTHIPVRDPAVLTDVRPDYVLILPWNIAEEIVSSMGHVRDWGGRFVAAVPEIREL